LLPSGNPSFSAFVIFFSETSGFFDLLTPYLLQAGKKIKRIAIITAANRMIRRL